MNKRKFDKIRSQIPVSGDDLHSDPMDTAKWQAAFLSRRYGINAERARSIAPLVFDGGPA